MPPTNFNAISEGYVAQPFSVVYLPEGSHAQYRLFTLIKLIDSLFSSGMGRLKGRRSEDELGIGGELTI